MSEPYVFVCKRGELKRATKVELKEAGIVVVELNDVNECRFVRPSVEVDSDEMLWACINALSSKVRYGHEREDMHSALVANLNKVITKRVFGDATPQAIDTDHE